VLGAVALTALVAASGIATPSASATNEVPQAVVGDPHSPTVARLATFALDAKAVFERTDDVADRRHFEVALADVAAATALELGVSRISVERAWTAADTDHQTAVLAALTQLGVEYRSNSSEPFVGFDCSGLTTFAWGEAGVQLSRQSGSQISEADERSPETAMAGDLVQYPGHVMMYLGVENAVVHSSNPENDVELWMLGDRSVRWGDPTA
jgi:cell wall-associated NlpC family hydrolase